MQEVPANRRIVWFLWCLILAALLVGALFSLTVFFTAARLPFEEAQRLVDSLSADNKVTSFTPVLYDQLLGFTLVFGSGLLVIALLWIFAHRRSSMWTYGIWTEMSTFIAADRAQIKAARKSAEPIPLLSVLIPASFWTIYVWFGFSLYKTVIFRWYNMIFDADVPYVIPALTQWGGQSERHPLLTWLVSPFGAALNHLLNSPQAAAVIVNASAGALTIWLVLLILVRLGLSPFTAALWAGVLGLSTTHVIFASIPESYIFAASSLALGLYLMLVFPGNLLYFIPAGIYTFGITLSNLVHTAIAFQVGLAGAVSSHHERFRRLFIFLFTVVFAAALMNFVLIAVTGFGSIFLLPDVYKENFEYVARDRSASLASRVGLLAENFFLFNIAGPNLYITGLEMHDDPAKNLVLPDGLLNPDDYHRSSFATYIFSSVKHAGVQSYIAWLIWIGLLVLGLVGIIRRRLYRHPLTIAVLFSLLFNFLFHIVWGWDSFLYTPHWTFMLVLLAAFGIGNSKYELQLQLILLILMLMLGWNNAILLSRISLIFSG